MGSLVFAGATSHVSGIIRAPHAHPEHSSLLATAWDTMAAGIAAADPDVVVLISPDHHEAFGLDNLPVFAIGSARVHRAIGEHGIPTTPVTGSPDLAQALHASLVASQFDVSIAHEMPLDHGFLVPAMRLGLGSRAIVPLCISSNTPPLPTLGRCRGLGEALRHAIEELSDGTRVAVLGLGGLSHWVAVPRMGELNEEWDRRVLGLFADGDLDALTSMTDADIEEEAGNGALEIRTWVAAASCAGGKGRTLAYAPMYKWVTGIGVVELEVAAR